MLLGRAMEMRNRLRGRAEIWEQSGVNYGGGDAFFGVIRLGYMWGRRCR